MIKTTSIFQCFTYAQETYSLFVPQEFFMHRNFKGQAILFRSSAHPHNRLLAVNNVNNINEKQLSIQIDWEQCNFNSTQCKNDSSYRKR